MSDTIVLNAVLVKYKISFQYEMLQYLKEVQYCLWPIIKTIVNETYTVVYMYDKVNLKVLPISQQTLEFQPKIVL